MSEVYLDKIKLGAMIVEKELNLIELFNTLIYDIRVRPDIKGFLNEYPPYFNCWRNLAELYDFLEYDYLDKIGKDKAKIKKVMDGYRYEAELKMEDLKEGFRIIRLIMSKSKFHDVVRKGEDSGGGLDGIKRKYGL